MFSVLSCGDSVFLLVRSSLMAQTELYLTYYLRALRYSLPWVFMLTNAVLPHSRSRHWSEAKPGRMGAGNRIRILCKGALNYWAVSLVLGLLIFVLEILILCLIS